MVDVKCVGGMLISLSKTIEPAGRYTTEYVTQGRCDARPTVTFPAAANYRLAVLIFRPAEGRS